MTLRDIAIALGFVVDNESEKKAEDTINGIKDMAVTALGAIGIGFSLAAMNEITEEFQAINDEIRSGTEGLGQQKDIQQQILAAAQETRTEYGYIGKYVSRLVTENKELFGNVSDAVAYTETLTKMFKAAGKSNEEIDALMESVNNSFAHGAVDSETITQLLEQAPQAAQYLAEELGTTIDKLEEMNSAGKITLQNLYDSTMKNAAEIEKDFGNVRYTISDALTHVRNRWGLWLEDLNSTTEFTETIGTTLVKVFDKGMLLLDKFKNGIVWVTQRLGGMDNVLKLVSISMGALAAVGISMQKGKILSFLGNAVKMLKAVNVQALVVMAIVLALILVIDDFINFMKGNDSMIGEALKAAGIDADAMRDRIAAAFDGVREVAGELLSLLEPLWDMLSQFWSDWGNDILAVVGNVVSGVLVAIEGILNMLSGLLTFLKGVFTGDWDMALSGLQKMWDSFWNAIRDIFQPVIDWIDKTFGDKIDAMVKKVTDFWDKVKEIFGKVGDFFSGIGEGIGNFFGEVGDFFGGDKPSYATVNNSTGTGGNKTNNIKQEVNIQQTYNGTDSNTIRKGNSAAKDVTKDMADALKYDK